MSKKYFQLFFFVLPILFLQAFPASAQVMIENFDYSTGQLTDNVGGANVSGGNWVDFSGTGFFIQVTNGSLTYSGYPASGTGNKIEITNPTLSAEDAYRQFTAQAPDATVYASFLLNLPNTAGLCASTSTDGDYFVALLPSTSTSTYMARLIIKDGSAADTYWLGLRASSSNASSWRPINLNAGTTYLVVLGYNIISGETNDVVKLWINPVLTGSEPAADITQTSALATDPADIARFAVRQGYVTIGDGTPNAAIDGIMISNAWADIGGTVFSVQSVSPSNSASEVGQKPVISATFNSLVDAATANATSFLVSGRKVANYTADSIRPQTNSNTFYFYPHDSLVLGDTITATLTTAITDTGGRTLSSNYTWTFYTIVPETIKPYLISSVPADGAERIAVSSTVALTFSEALLPATVDTGSFELLGKKRSRYPINAPVLSAGNTVVTLTPTDTLYYGDTIEVHIKPRVTDLLGNGVQDTSVQFTTRLLPYLTIYDVQYTTGGSPGTSPYNGDTVTVSGVVTAVLKTGYFFIQDGPGQWNGIYIYKYSEVTTPKVGDSVSVTGTVSEFHGLTEITVKADANLVIHKNNCVLPAPAIVSTGTITYPWSSSSESYESVLIEVRNAIVVGTDTTYKEWQVNDGSGVATINDFIATATETGYNPVIGDTLIYIRGIVDCYDNFKIEPRRMGDVMDNKPVKISSTIPANNEINVPTIVAVRLNFNKPMQLLSIIPENFTLSGKLNGPVSFSVTYDTSSWSCYLTPSQSFAGGDSIVVTARHTLVDSFGRTLDGNGDGVSVSNSTDDYSFTFVTLLGAIPIGTVQKAGPDGFSSAMEGQSVTIQGVITGPPKYFSSTSWTSSASLYIQDETGGVNLYVSGTNMGNTMLKLGQLCVATGQVTEYNGVTEVVVDTSNFRYWGLVPSLPAPIAMIYNQLLGEPIEGLLASVEGTISSVPAYAGGGYNMEIRNGNAPVAVRISEASKFDLSPFIYGTKVRVTGIVSQYDKEAPYNSGYQLVPRFGEVEYFNGIPLPLDIVVLTDSAAASASAEIVSIKPNPFSLDLGEVGIIEINAPPDNHLTLRIYDLKGRLVKTCLNNVPGGHQYYYWDGTDDSSRRANIGMYIAHLRSVTAEGAISNKTKIIVLGTPLK